MNGLKPSKMCFLCCDTPGMVCSGVRRLQGASGPFFREFYVAQNLIKIAITLLLAKQMTKTTPFFQREGGGDTSGVMASWYHGSVLPWYGITTAAWHHAYRVPSGMFIVAARPKTRVSLTASGKARLAWPGLGWPRLAWPGLARPGLAWPHSAPSPPSPRKHGHAPFGLQNTPC